jgi:septal ring factor EnvC (AmiA/AmiB activator)
LTPQRRFSSSLDLTLEALESPPVLEIPLDLVHLDHVVRTDCNAFALQLATSVSSLQQKSAHLDVVLGAHAVDLKLAALRESIVLVEARHEALRGTVFAIPDTLDSIDRLARAAGEAGPVFDAQRSEISRSFSPIRQLLHKMDVTCSESTSSRHLCLSRSEALDDMEARFHAWSDNAKALLSVIRHREERLRAAQREQIRRERLEAEAAEKLRKVQAESEAKLKAEQEREKEEREREEAELLHREEVEAQERMREERERAEEATREQVRKETALSSHAFSSSAGGAFPIENNRGLLILSLLFECN